MTNKTILLGSSILVTALFAQPAFAQIQDEVIVTATKRTQTLQETPVAVTVTSADTIEKSKISDIADLQSVVPSLRVTQLQNSVQTNFVIRGFGNGANNPGIEPSVGVFIDGVYRSRSAGAIADLPNLERVEVLRGPQSTLFGKNASAGVISITTAKPSHDFTGNVEATFGNYNQMQLKGYVSGPISENVAFSLSGGYNKRDGYYKNLASGDDQNDRDRWNVRGQLLFEPSDDLTVRIIGDYDKIDEICCGVANLVNGPTGAAVIGIGGNLVPNAPFARKGYYDLNPTNEVSNKGISMEVDWAHEKFDITSISAYRDQDVLFDGDVDFTSAQLISQNIEDRDSNFFSQELRIASSGDNRFDWLLGGFYFNEDLNAETSLNYGPGFRAYADVLTAGALASLEPLYGLTPNTFFAASQGLMTDFTQDNESYSVFAQGDLHASNRATLTFGVNYTNDSKDVTGKGTSTDVFSGLDLNNTPTFVGGGLPLPTVLTAQGFPDITAACGLGELPFSPTNVGALFMAQTCFGPLAGLTGQQAYGVLTSGVADNISGLQQLQFLPPFLGFPNSAESGSSNDDKITWTARASYELYDTVNVYASYSTGYKATTWNLSRDSRPASLAAVVAPGGPGVGVNNLSQGSRFAGPEESTVYEAGVKARWSRGSLNLAVFDQSIKGFQSNIFTGTGFVLANAGEQSTIGAEAEMEWSPADPWLITAAATWLDPKYDSFVDGPPAPGSSTPTDLSGERPAGIPTISFYTSATYTHDFDGVATGFIRGDYQHESEVDVVDNVPSGLATRKVDVINASVGINLENGFGGMLWARNLTGNDYLLSAFPSVAQAGSYSGYPNAPATYGITLNKKW